MEFKDYYKILGIDKSATKEEIKRQYRRLARKYHPDVNPGDKSASAKFADINEAHEVLTDDEKRKKYDALGPDWQQYADFGPNKSRNQGQYSNRNGAQYSFYEGDFDDIFGGGGGFSDFFKAIFGDTFSGFEQRESTYTKKGQDYRAELEITLEEAYTKCVRVINVNGQNLRITLDPGIKDGQTIKLKGKGGPGYKGGKNGDLYITIRIPLHPFYKRVGNDLFIGIPVSIYKALLGGNEEIDVLSGRFKIKIPPETETGTTFRLKGKGFPVYNNPGKTGDLYVTISLQIPKNLTDKEKKMIKELAGMRSFA
ncbi:MAG: J domain-containing protein [Spirochaetales bacterium]|nr:J domain-containing protein [Spirochaetales bacterium]